MGVNFERFKAEHVALLDEQDATLYATRLASQENFKALEASEWAFTGKNDMGKIVICVGIHKYWDGRGEAWVLLSRTCGGKDFLSIHRQVKAFLDTCPLARIEAAIDCDFVQGHRWLKLLGGFELECARRRKYSPNGRDAALYARVREG